MSSIENVAVMGLGYVGCAMASLLAQNVKVTGFDTDVQKVNLLNNRICPVDDADLSSFLQNERLDLDCREVEEINWLDFDTVIICIPTDYDQNHHALDTSGIRNIVNHAINQNPNILIFIKSTIPVGFTEQLREETKNNNIYFSPEFLREGKALYDNLYPKRIIVGGHGCGADTFAQLLVDCARQDNTPVLLTKKASEAEVIKLLSNTFIAARVAFFNEVDTYCMAKSLDAKTVIDGICLDPRIGNDYNNPSFGYGGYCLPKDTKQMQTEFGNLPAPLIKSIARSNDARIDQIVSEVLKKKVTSVGLLDLSMKAGSDNIRESTIIEVGLKLLHQNINIFYAHSKEIFNTRFEGFKYCKNLDELDAKSDLILTNRTDTNTVKMTKIFTRDLYHIN